MLKCVPMGRSDDMLIVKGVNVFPSQIETVLYRTSGGGSYIEVQGNDKRNVLGMERKQPAETG